MIKKIFLGGTTNNSTWREKLISLLNTNKISYFNPMINGREWTLEDQEREFSEKDTSNYLLYVITKEIIGFYTIAEVVDDSNKYPQRTIFCYLEEGFETRQVRSLEAIAKLVKKNGSQVFISLQKVADYLNNQARVELSTNISQRSEKNKQELIETIEQIEDKIEITPKN